MGKRNKDRMYIKTSEYSDGMGGMKEMKGEGPKYVLLPFTYCCLTFLPIEDAVFTSDGRCYERAPLYRYLQDNKKNPATGGPLAKDEIFTMKIHKAEDGTPTCPVTLKPLTEHSHVVAIKTTGRVYSATAVDEMNVKAKNWADLIDGTPFRKADIITIQDPKKMVEERNTTKFHHVIADDDGKKKKKKKTKAKVESVEPVPDPLGIYTTTGTFGSSGGGFAAAGFTCSAATPLKKDSKKKTQKDVETEIFTVMRSPEGGETLCRVETTLGDLDVKLFSNIVPKTCYNFVKLAQQGYYNGVTFHRVIRDFMAQTGDPTATGCGGASYWGKPFEDEFHVSLKHNRRGLLSMANSGADSNGSQFFFTTSASLPHLDRKHTVFGQVIGSLSVLDQINATPTTGDDKSDVKILNIDVYRNPFPAVESKVHDLHDPTKQAALRAAQAQHQKDASEVRPWFSAPQPTLPNSSSAEIGKYMGSGDKNSTEVSAVPSSLLPPAKKSKKWDFAGW